MIAADSRGKLQRSAGWISWVLGAALLFAVIIGVLHFSEQEKFARLAQRAQPLWLAVAIVLQAATYLAQGGIWRRVVGACGYPLSREAAFELSLAKLFADQALPSAGISSGILITRALGLRRLPSSAVNATVLINITSYHLAYAIALVAAVAIMIERGLTNAPIVVASVLFLIFSVGLSTAVLLLVGRRHERLADSCRRIPAVRPMLAFLAAADAGLVLLMTSPIRRSSRIKN